MTVPHSKQKTVGEESRLLRLFVFRGSHPFSRDDYPVEEGKKGIILNVKYFLPEIECFQLWRLTTRTQREFLPLLYMVSHK